MGPCISIIRKIFTLSKTKWKRKINLNPNQFASTIYTYRDEPLSVCNNTRLYIVHFTCTISTNSSPLYQFLDAFFLSIIFVFLHVDVLDREESVSLFHAQWSNPAMKSKLCSYISTHHGFIHNSSLFLFVATFATDFLVQYWTRSNGFHSLILLSDDALYWCISIVFVYAMLLRTANCQLPTANIIYWDGERFCKWKGYTCTYISVDVSTSIWMYELITSIKYEFIDSKECSMLLSSFVGLRKRKRT